MIESRSNLLVVTVLCTVSFANSVWSQQGFDLINDLDLLVPASAKEFDQMLDVDIDEADIVKVGEIEATYTAVERSRRLLDFYKPRFEDVHKRELRFLHSVVRLKRSEFDAIDGDLSLETKKAFLESVQGAVNQQNIKNAGWKQHLDTEPGIDARTRALQDKLLRLVEDHVAPKRAALYAGEIRARRDFEKEAVIESIVTSITLKFVLSIPQREQVEQLVRDHWQEAWRDDVSELIDYGVGCIRDFPKQELRRLLRSRQIVFFESIQWDPNRRPRFPQVTRNARASQDLADELDFAPEDEGQK